MNSAVKSGLNMVVTCLLCAKDFAQHRLQERERCARIAEAYAVEMDKPYTALTGMQKAAQLRYEGHRYAGLNIATAIRQED